MNNWIINVLGYIAEMDPGNQIVVFGVKNLIENKQKENGPCRAAFVTTGYVKDAVISRACSID